MESPCGPAMGVLVAKQRSTFGKLDRQRAQQATAKAKQDRRMARSNDQPGDAPAAAIDPAEQADLLDRFARLHAAFDDGRIGLEDFELRRDELRARLQM
jgi:hypothetical protein